MHKVHYQNVGLPKCGTSWLWFALNRSKDLIGHPTLKENSAQLREGQKEEYLNFYKNLDVSINFDPMTHTLTNDRITEISEYTTHVSFILRNPYEILNSWFNGNRNKDMIASVRTQWEKQYNQIDELSIMRWSNFKNKFAVWYYDDLVAHPYQFYENACNWIGITPGPKSVIKIKSNVTKFSEQLIHDRMTIRVINTRIDKLSNFLNKDLSHWKK